MSLAVHLCKPSSTEGIRVVREISSVSTKGRALVKEIILEDFMSYEYARIPLKPGLNMICGPNGSGKSSILLALAVALGQAYTERSRRLSDLIRRGKDLARATILLDNTPIGSSRPIKSYDSDLVRISRYLRRDGVYWYEAEYRNVTKAEIVRLLSDLGINPDNMLIIMHQNMVEEFSVLNPPQRLKMVEDAIGFQPYRERILEAYNQLTNLLSEEESLANLINNAEQTLNYWRGEYEKFLRRNELLERRRELESEQAWAEVIRVEKALKALRENAERSENRLKQITLELNEAKSRVEENRSYLNNLCFEQKKAFLTLLEREKEKTGNETALTIVKDQISRLEECRTLLEKTAKELQRKFKEENVDVEMAIRSLKDGAEVLSSYSHSLRDYLKTVEQKIPNLESAIAEAQSRIGLIEEENISIQEKFVEAKVDEVVKTFRKELLEEEVAKVTKEIKSTAEELENLTALAEKISPRVETERSPAEIADEIKMTLAKLASIGEVSEDSEKAYRNYLRLYEELKGKIEVVSENRRKALEEVEVRKQTWRRIIQNFIEKVDLAYQEILSKIGASGGVRLVNLDDIESAGLELVVGFRGAAPTILDAYTQSGGERTTAIMAFLLALQQHVRSPIRAVDEFETHMDPRNREIISKLILSSVKSQMDFQYIIITPGQILTPDPDVHVITVQNIQGRSEVRVGGTVAD
ncbi:MAG: hypothetical protein QXJ75_04260 [Candidatus Bathyarchaeia archaeon]